MGDAGEAALIAPQLTRVKQGLSLIEPLSRRGHGPGLIVLVPDVPGGGLETQLDIKDGVPSALMKWGEESYTVVEIRREAVQADQNVLKSAIEALSHCEKCEPKDVVGLVSYSPELWNQIAGSISSVPEIKGAVLYADAQSASELAKSQLPSIQHLAGKAGSPLTRSPHFTAYEYPAVSTHLFATPFHNDFHYATESVSHTRSLEFLKRTMNGPHFDLEAIWDEHTYYEFGDRSTDKTMATMVEEPYVNHIPTITGGIGRKKLSEFYQHNFIFCNPADTELELISRTVGVDRVVDEFIFKFTHDREIPWLAPGIPPTQRYCQIPFMAVVNIRGDRLYHEHISWDGATVLVQMGLMPQYLAFPYPLPDGKQPASGKKFEFRVPTAGAETAQKMRVKDSVPSNEMFEFAVREVDA